MAGSVYVGLTSGCPLGPGWAVCVLHTADGHTSTSVSITLFLFCFVLFLLRSHRFQEEERIRTLNVSSNATLGDPRMGRTSCSCGQSGKDRDSQVSVSLKAPHLDHRPAKLDRCVHAEEATS